MPTTHVRPHQAELLQSIADSISKARKIIVVTGAGISTNSGIPDFRSENGLYSLIQAQYDAAAAQEKERDDDDGFANSQRPQKRRRLDVNTGEDEIDVKASSLSSSSSSTPCVPTNSFVASKNLDGSPLSDPPAQFTRQSLASSHGSAAGRSSSVTPSEMSTDDTSTSSSQDAWASNSAAAVAAKTVSTMKGKDLFDCSIWTDPLRTSVFYTFATTLRQKSQDVSPTDSHHFIVSLRDRGKLVRCYTQNIDRLEERVGLSTSLQGGPGSRGRFSRRSIMVDSRVSTPQSTKDDDGPCSLLTQTSVLSECAIDVVDPLQANIEMSLLEEPKKRTLIDRGVECVFLHGSLELLRCFRCGLTVQWEIDDRLQETLAGGQPECPHCVGATVAREERGKRALGVGKLRPDIVLYGEEHPQADLIGPIVKHDLTLVPDMMLILGTSLRVHGLKVMVREFARAVHEGRGVAGKVIFVNFTQPSESVWGDVIDYWVQWDCDAWVGDLRTRAPGLWEDAPKKKAKIKDKDVQEAGEVDVKEIKEDEETTPKTSVPKDVPKDVQKGQKEKDEANTGANTDKTNPQTADKPFRHSLPAVLPSEGAYTNAFFGLPRDQFTQARSVDGHEKNNEESMLYTLASATAYIQDSSSNIKSTPKRKRSEDTSRDGASQLLQAAAMDAKAAAGILQDSSTFNIQSTGPKSKKVKLSEDSRPDCSLLDLLAEQAARQAAFDAPKSQPKKRRSYGPGPKPLPKFLHDMSRIDSHAVWRIQSALARIGGRSVDSKKDKAEQKHQGQAYVLSHTRYVGGDVKHDEPKGDDKTADNDVLQDELDGVALLGGIIARLKSGPPRLTRQAAAAPRRPPPRSVPQYFHQSLPTDPSLALLSLANRRFSERELDVAQILAEEFSARLSSEKIQQTRDRLQHEPGQYNPPDDDDDPSAGSILDSVKTNPRLRKRKVIDGVEVALPRSATPRQSRSLTPGPGCRTAPTSSPGPSFSSLATPRPLRRSLSFGGSPPRPLAPPPTPERGRSLQRSPFLSSRPELKRSFSVSAALSGFVSQSTVDKLVKEEEVQDSTPPRQQTHTPRRWVLCEGGREYLRVRGARPVTPAGMARRVSGGIVGRS